MTPIEKLYHVAVKVNTEDVKVAVILSKEEGEWLSKYFDNHAVIYEKGEPKKVISNKFGAIKLFNKTIYIYII